jgi:hypothetical protein
MNRHSVAFQSGLNGVDVYAETARAVEHAPPRLAGLISGIADHALATAIPVADVREALRLLRFLPTETTDAGSFAAKRGH